MMTPEEIEELAEKGKRWRAHDGSHLKPDEIRNGESFVVVYSDGFSKSHHPFKSFADPQPDWKNVVGWRYD